MSDPWDPLHVHLGPLGHPLRTPWILILWDPIDISHDPPGTTYTPPFFFQRMIYLQKKIGPQLHHLCQ